MADPTVAEMATTITEKLEALDARMSDEEFDRRFDERIAGLEPSDELVRKVRFAGGDPKLTGSKFGRLGLGVGDIEHLMLLTEAGQRANKGPGPSDELRKAFDAVTQGRMLDAVSAEAADFHAVEEMYERGELDMAGYKRGIANVRAMDTSESGFGSQLIGNQYANTLWAGAKVQSRLFDLIPTFEMTAPTAFLPVAAAPPAMAFVAEKASATVGEGYGTVKTGSNRVQVDAKKFLIREMWSGEMQEDSLIPFLPFLTEMAQLSLAQYLDWAVLNGDTTDSASNINDDGGALGGTEYFLAWDGLRHAGLVDNTSNGTDQDGAAITWDALIDMRKLMLSATYFNDWGHPNDPADLIYVVNPALGDEIVKLDEVISIDKYGSSATVLTGEVGNIARHPLITTIGQELTEADGFVDNSPSLNRSTATAFNRRGSVIGNLRSLQVKVGEFIESDQFQIVYSMRKGYTRFTPTGAASGIESVAVLYNIK